MSGSGICASRWPRTIRSGRVFIAGDAAHSHPPYGGYGLNNGLDDVANLGWKLAARLSGWGSDALLQSYTEERQPIFKETGRGLHRGRHRARRSLPRSLRSRNAIARNSNTPGRTTPAPRRRACSTYEPHYEGSPIVFGPPRRRQQRARLAHLQSARRPSSAAAAAFLRAQCVRGARAGFHLACLRRRRPDVAAFEKAARASACR